MCLLDINARADQKRQGSKKTEGIKKSNERRGGNFLGREHDVQIGN